EGMARRGTGGEGVTLGDDVFTRASDTEELVSETARAGISRRDQNLAGSGIVQGIIHTGNRARGVTKRGMRRDVLDALAIDIDLAVITQAFKILGAREGAGCADRVFRLLPIHRSLRS